MENDHEKLHKAIDIIQELMQDYKKMPVDVLMQLSDVVALTIAGLTKSKELEKSEKLENFGLLIKKELFKRMTSKENIKPNDPEISKRIQEILQKDKDFKSQTDAFVAAKREMAQRTLASQKTQPTIEL